jgi:hypothetical protein
MAFTNPEKLQVVKRKIKELFESTEFDAVSSFADLKTYMAQVDGSNIAATISGVIDEEVLLRAARSSQELSLNTNLQELRDELITLFL